MSGGRLVTPRIALRLVEPRPGEWRVRGQSDGVPGAVAKGPESHIQKATPWGSMAGSDCIFCSIVEGATPSWRVHGDEVTVAFLDIGQVTPGRSWWYRGQAPPYCCGVAQGSACDA